MVKTGPAKKLTIYLDESDTVRGKPVYEVLIEFLYKKKISGASVFRGIEGYGSDGVFHSAKILSLSTSLPVKIEAVDSEAIIHDVLPEISSIVRNGLIELSDTFVIKCCGGRTEE